MNSQQKLAILSALFCGVRAAGAQKAITGAVLCLRGGVATQPQGIEFGLVTIGGQPALSGVTAVNGFFTIDIGWNDRGRIAGRNVPITVGGQTTVSTVQFVAEQDVRRLGRQVVFTLHDVHFQVACEALQVSDLSALTQRRDRMLADAATQFPWRRWIHSLGFAAGAVALRNNAVSFASGRVDSIFTSASTFAPPMSLDPTERMTILTTPNPGFDFTAGRQLSDGVFQNPATLDATQPAQIVGVMDNLGSGRLSASTIIADALSIGVGTQVSRQREDRTVLFGSGPVSLSLPSVARSYAAVAAARVTDRLSLSVRGRMSIVKQRALDSVLTLPHFRFSGFSAGPPTVHDADTTFSTANFDLGAIGFADHGLTIGAVFNNVLGDRTSGRFAGEGRAFGVGGKLEVTTLQIGAEMVSTAAAATIGSFGLDLAIGRSWSALVGFNTFDHVITIGCSLGDVAYAVRAQRGAAEHVVAVRERM
jgi:hypothetical protein